ncbi:hypothetical protein Q4485_12475 [Granulosicoccaceae sp. 1_MG-2023]|nr:hypothetical protein [Granulosicoccaceae sp. 1_MG-2023]
MSVIKFPDSTAKAIAELEKLTQAEIDTDPYIQEAFPGISRDMYVDLIIGIMTSADRSGNSHEDAGEHTTGLEKEEPGEGLRYEPSVEKLSFRKVPEFSDLKEARDHAATLFKAAVRHLKDSPADRRFAGKMIDAASTLINSDDIDDVRSGISMLHDYVYTGSVYLV